MIKECKHKEGCSGIRKCPYSDVIVRVARIMLTTKPSREAAEQIDSILGDRLFPEYQGEEIHKMIIHLASASAICAKETARVLVSGPSPSRYTN